MNREHVSVLGKHALPPPEHAIHFSPRYLAKHL